MNKAILGWGLILASVLIVFALRLQRDPGLAALGAFVTLPTLWYGFALVFSTKPPVVGRKLASFVVFVKRLDHHQREDAFLKQDPPEDPEHRPSKTLRYGSMFIATAAFLPVGVLLAEAVLFPAHLGLLAGWLASVFATYLLLHAACADPRASSRGESIG